jgi:hypothetical protein
MRTRQLIVGALLAAAILGGSIHVRADIANPVHYPEGYRSWVVAKSRFIGPNSPAYATSGGMRHHYANAAGAESWGSGTFADGSILVDERMHTSENSDGVWVEGKVAHLAVMQKDSQRFAATGGWGFNVFREDDKSVGLTQEQAKRACFEACHQKQAQRDFTFSDYRR